MDTISGKEFLREFFSKLKGSDFNFVIFDPNTHEETIDPFLDSYMKAYKSEVRSILTEAKKNGTAVTASDIPTKFSYYIEYIIRNKVTDHYEKDLLIERVCDEIAYYIINPPKDDYEIINKPAIAVEKKQEQRPSDKVLETKVVNTAIGNMVNSANSELEEYKKVTIKKNEKCAISKRESLRILSLYIQRSFIARDNAENAESGTEATQNCKKVIQSNLEEDIERDILMGERPPLPPPVKDKEFGRRNELQTHWAEIETSCKEICKNKYAREKISGIEVFAGDSIRLDRDEKVITEVFQNYEDDLPAVVLSSKWAGIHSDVKIHFHNQNYMSVCKQLAALKQKFALVVSASSFVPGGNSDQGISTNETILYHTSTYSVALNKISFVYPCKSTLVFHIPYVFVFQEYNDGFFRKLEPGYSMQVIVSNVNVRPKTNLVDQSTTEYDIRLRENTALLASPSMYSSHIESTLKACIFLGYSEIILDDHAIDTFWYPTYHTISLFCETLKKYKTFFKKIHICIEDKNLLGVFVNILGK